MLKTGGFEAVKLEGGQALAGHVSALVSAGIPVMGHVGSCRSPCTRWAAFASRQGRGHAGRAARRRPRDRRRGRVRNRARGDRATSDSASPSRSRSRRLASEQGLRATARCSSAMTSSACTRA